MGVENYKPNPCKELTITLNDGVQREIDDLFSENVDNNYALPQCSAKMNLYTCKE